ncbi:hypothetical protein [Halobacillus shinanisalinarum]|nr:hypothetical protein [Halobacillus shinanisalinarum]
MQEHVGNCSQCGKEVFCLDGFLNGVVSEDKSLYCFECADKNEDS